MLWQPWISRLLVEDRRVVDQDVDLCPLPVRLPFPRAIGKLPPSPSASLSAHRRSVPMGSQPGVARALARRGSATAHQPAPGDPLSRVTCLLNRLGLWMVAGPSATHRVVSSIFCRGIGTGSGSDAGGSPDLHGRVRAAAPGAGCSSDDWGNHGCPAADQAGGRGSRANSRPVGWRQVGRQDEARNAPRSLRLSWVAAAPPRHLAGRS